MKTKQNITTAMAALVAIAALLILADDTNSSVS